MEVMSWDVQGWVMKDDCLVFQNTNCISQRSPEKQTQEDVRERDVRRRIMRNCLTQSVRNPEISEHCW